MSGCDVLFRKYFARWYRLAPGRKIPRVVKCDLEIYAEAAGTSALNQCRLGEERRAKVASEVDEMVDAAREDWHTYLDVHDPVSIDGLDAFDRHWTRRRIAEVIRASQASDFANDYLVICCELGAVLGEVFRQQNDDLAWLYGSPYWESSLWHSPTGTLVNVFYWAIKKMSSYGADDGLRPKLLAGLRNLERHQ